MVAPFWRRAPLIHPISGSEILLHSDRVAAWTLARCGVPNFRTKIELCVNAVDVPANITTATNPNHRDTAFLPSLSPQEPKRTSYCGGNCSRIAKSQTRIVDQLAYGRTLPHRRPRTSPGFSDIAEVGPGIRCLLRARRERPGSRSAAAKQDEVAPLHVWMAPAWQEKM
jgi:hypothetical protein